MLSFVSDEAVAAIGVVNQMMMFPFVLFNFTAMGSGVVVAQFVGANKLNDVSKTIANAIFINLLFGFFISSMIVIFRYQFLNIFHMSRELIEYADIYILIVGGTLFTQAMVMTLFSVLQAQGFTKEVMYVALGMNNLNIIGNYFVIFGPFGLPKLGVMGVAISTAVCRDSKGVWYPSSVDEQSGKTLLAPASAEYKKVPEDQRVKWGPTERKIYKTWYESQYGIRSWNNIEIHHIIPRAYGGSNDPANLISLPKSFHRGTVNSWWTNN
ncbi:MATE family efflux transporter [Gracilibacillus saliphilus]|uniref:MATE family efflux transporter n=1 Tax=Gracilibacillus saliphilus TaxID=543890 RepID=UPI001EE15A5F|nr:MATE family efflux transporter [Gracilibacillus saliphilus]